MIKRVMDNKGTNTNGFSVTRVSGFPRIEK